MDRRPSISEVNSPRVRCNAGNLAAMGAPAGLASPLADSHAKDAPRQIPSKFRSLARSLISETPQAELRPGPVLEQALPRDRRCSCCLPSAVELREFRVPAFVQDVGPRYTAIITNRDPFTFASGRLSASVVRSMQSCSQPTTLGFPLPATSAACAVRPPRAVTTPAATANPAMALVESSRRPRIRRRSHRSNP